MFFTLSKLTGFFTQPSNFLLTLAGVGILLTATRYSRAGRVCTIVAVLFIVVFGLSPASNLLIYPLEQRFPVWDGSRGAPDGIVILGGAIAPEPSAARGTAALNEAAERVTSIAGLARRYPQARIVYSGGNSRLLSAELDEAQFAIELLENFGVARERILLERRSRNTVENAIFTKDTVAPKSGERWLLVTSAHHMPRSVGVFRQVGFPVEAYPVDWRTSGPSDLTSPMGTVSDGLKRTDTAMHEWIGLLAYWLAGKTPQLFPGPDR
jgi:uncharacterized SAM-binding protein YcdF (DUF218 family)